MLREFAIAAGLGRKRPRLRKEARPKMGSEGEDVVADEAGGLKLHCPARFQPGTMKAAAWQVHPIPAPLLCTDTRFRAAW